MTHFMGRLAFIAMSTALLASCTDQPVAPTAAAVDHNAAAAALGDNDARRFEVPYMKQTIDHHAMGVMMATLCVQKAVHQELIDLCQINRTNQQRESEQLQTWLREWYGIDYTPHMQPGDERMMERLAALSPTEFEMEFLEMFSRHHWVIIHRSIPIARHAIHLQLQEMAQSIIINQYHDVELMRTWLCEWYDRCLPVPPLPSI